uniref:Reticulon-like protein n=1 Tax=Anthurium amnicola TaxID=1678845 RepID=A0A1D1Z8G3_9ARAE
MSGILSPHMNWVNSARGASHKRLLEGRSYFSGAQNFLIFENREEYSFLVHLLLCLLRLHTYKGFYLVSISVGLGHRMESSSQDVCNVESSSDARKDRSLEQCGPSAAVCPGYRLFNRQRSIRQIMGSGKAADVILWKRRRMSFGVVAVATAAWLLVEWSGLSFLSISSDVLLILIVIQFIRANFAVLLNKQLQPLPELVLSEEMVNNTAASFRVKINSMLLMAHDITLGKDFRLFFKVVVCLWLLSVIGSFFSFLTLAYIGIIVSITMPALYNKYEEHVDRYAGLVHQKFSKHYNIVDENIIQRLPKRFSKNKDV